MPLYDIDWSKLMDRLMPDLRGDPRDQMEKLEFVRLALCEAQQLTDSLLWAANRDKSARLHPDDRRRFDQKKLALRHMLTGLEMILGSTRTGKGVLADESARLDLLHAAKMSPGSADVFLRAAAEHDPTEDEEAMALLESSKRSVSDYMTRYGTALE